MCRLCARAEKCSMHGGWIGGGRQVNSWMNLEDIDSIAVSEVIPPNGQVGMTKLRPLSRRFSVRKG